MQAGAQTYSILVIDKKMMKLKDAGFPKVVLDQTPKYLRGSKVPVVKAKIVLKVATLMCDAKIFDLIPVKKEVKAVMNAEEPTIPAGLLAMSNVVCTPHIGANTAQTRADMAAACARQILDALAGKRPEHIVNGL